MTFAVHSDRQATAVITTCRCCSAFDNNDQYDRVCYACWTGNPTCDTCVTAGVWFIQGDVTHLLRHQAGNAWCGVAFTPGDLTTVIAENRCQACVNHSGT